MILDREEFRSWLVAKEPDEIVGEKVPTEWMATTCAQARFLAETFGVKCVMSATRYGEARLFFDDAGLRHTPEWAAHFVFLHDRWMREHDKITAKEALTILDGIDA